MSRIVGRLLSELSYHRILNNRYQRRPTLEIVRKVEEFKHKRLEELKKKSPKNEKYENYMEALNWVLYANKTDY